MAGRRSDELLAADDTDGHAIWNVFLRPSPISHETKPAFSDRVN